jgi:hypothetical protein
MNYIKKTCPICSEEFFVLQDAEVKAVYCTLKCLLESVDGTNEINLIEPF